MKDLLLRMKARVEQAKAAGMSGLDPLSLLALSADYDHLLEQGWKANPPPSPPPDPPRGADGQPAVKRSRKQPPARKLRQRLQVGKRQALAFLYDFAVPFDNDVIAYCTPSAWLACFVRRVWSLFVGWRKQRNPTAIGVIHGNTTSLPPIPDRLWADSIGLCGFTGG
jgi:hypothetical protein